MFENLVKHLLHLEEAGLSEVSLENITLGACWYDSYRENDGISQTYAPLRQALDLWVKCATPMDTETEGWRQQPLLRILIKEAVKGHIGNMTRDELDFLYFAYGLAERANQDDLFDRPLSCLKPYVRDLHERRAALDSAPGLPSLAERIRIFMPEDIRSSLPCEVPNFAGLQPSFEGPLLAHRGHVKILGDIPEGCGVLVEEGDCHVQGSVLGHLAAGGTCEILRDIAGVAVARKGDVGARALLPDAVVVAKEGRITAISASGGKLVFAANGIKIRDGLSGGRYYAPSIQVGGEVTGGELQVTKVATASRFSSGANTELFIVLRRSLNCNDYGEVIPPEASKLISGAMRQRQRLANLQDLLNITERETDEYAGNVLMFLLGDEEKSDTIGKLQGRRRRLAFLDRLDAGLRAMIVLAEDRLSESRAKEGGEEAETNSRYDSADNLALVDDLRRELASLAGEGAVDRELLEIREETLLLGRRLQRRGMQDEGVMLILEKVVELSDRVRGERDTMKEEVSAFEAAYIKAMNRAAVLERAKAACLRVEVLDQLLLASRQRKGMDTFRRRSGDRQVKLLRRNIENRLAHAAEYQSSMADIENHIRKNRDELWAEFQISMPDQIVEGWSAQGARVTGCFDEGVRLCAWRHLVNSGSLGDRGLFVTRETTEEPVTYTRTPRGTIEPV